MRKKKVISAGGLELKREAHEKIGNPKHQLNRKHFVRWNSWTQNRKISKLTTPRHADERGISNTACISGKKGWECTIRGGSKR